MNANQFAATLLVGTHLLTHSAFAHSPDKDAALSARYWNWTGLYAGLNLGVVKNTMNITDNQGNSFYATIQQESDPSFTGGFQAGYRGQLNRNQTSGVYGLEINADFSDTRFNRNFGSPFAIYQLNSANILRDLVLVQLMGGIAADRALLFLALGFSWSNISGNVNNLDSIPFFNSFSVSKRTLGAAISGGTEYAFGEKLSARLKVDVIVPGNYTVSDTIGDTYQLSNHIVQGTLGVSYQFG